MKVTETEVRMASTNGLRAIGHNRAQIMHDGKSYMVEIVLITPTIARLWLTLNEGNRRISKVTVKRHAKSMLGGEWSLNGETIIFDSEGNLRNGQHRLTACVQSGASFVSFVVRGVEPAAFATMDRPKIRGGDDVLSINGYKNDRRLASAAGVLRQYLSGVHDYKASKFEPWETHETVKEHPDLEAACLASDTVRKEVPINGSVLAVAWYLFSRQDRELAALFFDSLKTGANLSIDDPIHLLRRMVWNAQKSRATLSRTDHFALLIKTWNAVRSGAKRKMLRWNTRGDNAEQFPSLGPVPGVTEG
jgi:hypothetical protein